MPEKLIEVRNLKKYFNTKKGLLHAVDDINFFINKGETLGLVGESGCGKTVTAYSIMRIVPRNAKTFGNIYLYKENNIGLIKLNLAEMDSSGKEIRQIRGSDISMIFQEPMTSFSAYYTIGNQIVEAILLHRTNDRKIAKKSLG